MGTSALALKQYGSNSAVKPRRASASGISLLPMIQFALLEHPFEIHAIVVGQCASGVLHAVVPLTLVHLPAAARPVHGTVALSPIVDELADILDAVPPTHLALARHAILLELASVDGAVGAQKLALAIRTSSFKLTRVLGALWPSHDTLSVTHALDIVANKGGPVEAELLAFPVSFIISPLALVLGAVGERQSANAMSHRIMELACVGRGIGIGRCTRTFLRRLSKRL